MPRSDSGRGVVPAYAVTDSDIELVKLSSETKEVFIRIAYSSWPSRFWTLQEALYTRRLLFHFSDKNIDLGALVKYGDIPQGWELAWRALFPCKDLRRYLDGASHGHRVRSEDHCALLLKELDGRAPIDRADVYYESFGYE